MTGGSTNTGRRWAVIIDQARQIVEASDYPLTLRAVHYRLLGVEGYRNHKHDYNYLSQRTAQGRRDGTFPALAEDVREVERPPAWSSPVELVQEAARQYRKDRSTGQRFQVWLCIEKRTLLPLLHTGPFANHGMSMLALGGYSSQTLCDHVRHLVHDDGREAVLLIASDFDPSGEDLARDFIARTDCWHHTERVALTEDDVTAYRLPPMMGKATDNRAADFIARHGRLVQVELDALDPGVLLQKFMRASDAFFDPAAYNDVLAVERAERQQLLAFVRTMET